MAAGVLAKPGEKYGPCVGECKHLDCASTREIAEWICRICAKPIDYGVDFYREDDPNGYVHATCLWVETQNTAKARQG